MNFLAILTALLFGWFYLSAYAQMSTCETFNIVNCPAKTPVLVSTAAAVMCTGASGCTAEDCCRAACGSGQAACKNGECIAAEKFGDGHCDCQDDSDEVIRCTHTPTPTPIKNVTLQTCGTFNVSECPASKPILTYTPETVLCGESSCTPDECCRANCPLGEGACLNGQCIALAKFGDLKCDCADGSDEFIPMSDCPILETNCTYLNHSWTVGESVCTSNGTKWRCVNGTWEDVGLCNQCYYKNTSYVNVAFICLENGTRLQCQNGTFVPVGLCGPQELVNCTQWGTEVKCASAWSSVKNQNYVYCGKDGQLSSAKSLCYPATGEFWCDNNRLGTHTDWILQAQGGSPSHGIPCPTA